MFALRRYCRHFASNYGGSSALGFTKSHEWIRFYPETKTIKIGISNYAQQQLGEIIHIDPSSKGKVVTAGDSVAVIESVKIAAEVYTPVAGKITNINEGVLSNPQLVNDKPLESWIIEMTSNEEPKGLMTEDEYNKIVS